MPTPFTHLDYAQRLRLDATLPAAARAVIAAHLPAYYLGSVAADGHGEAHLKREETHFYAYDRPMTDHPYRVMLAQFPALAAVRDPDQQAFLLGYTGHLALDEIWSLDMMKPHFVEREWASRAGRFFILHILLAYMDERDLAALTAEIAPAMAQIAPHAWAPFLPDAALRAWGAVITRQIVPGGVSETLRIMAPRVSRQPADLRAVLDDPARMNADLWAHIPPPLLAQIEAQMYAAALRQMSALWAGFGG